ncbi:MAG: inositol monophosphatase [Myxococcaceae bacterium]|jgi:myo-inositol-1(or 4)-monophosphatase|nr:inositol monophosphatase [Myxococcaceae bacterium]
MTPHELADVAERLARAAGALLRSKLGEARTVDFKGTGRSNLVTDADHAAEALVLEALAREVPHHGVLAEESGSVREAGTTWILDPLDGTTNYAHGVPHFCVSLAVEQPVDGATQVVAGVVYDPMRDELFRAVRGGGATANGKRLVASPTATLDRALLCTGFPYDLQQRPEAPLGLFNRLVRRAQGIRRMGSAALDLAYVAAGRFDGFFEFGLKPWDIAAGALLIEEAGGRIARIDGAPWDVRFGDVVAGAPGVFPSLAEQTAAFVKDIGWSPRRFSGG